MNKELTKIKKTDKESDIAQLQSAVSANLPRLTAAALASALGATVVLKMIATDTGKMKYVPINDMEELTNALEWISNHGNNFDQGEGGFYIVQQRPPDAKFWEMLTNRQLGKIPDELKADMTYKLDLAEIGRKAIKAKNITTTDSEVTYKEPVPSSWL